MHDLIEIIFTKLSLRYGRDFTAKWEGIDLNDVKNDWAHELSGFERAPHAIAYALQNLPDDKAPNVAQFRAIAHRAPAAQTLRIEPPAANPAVVRAALAQAHALLKRVKA